MFAQLLTRLGAALDRAAIPYMVIGGQAVLVHGEPRLTRDIDVTVGVGIDGIDRVLDVLAALGLATLPEDPRAFAATTMVVPAVDEASGIRVDVILSISRFEAEAIRRASLVAIGDGTMRVATAEDLVVLKVIAGRPRDLDDVRSILLRNPDLDRDHVVRWLSEFEAAVEGEVDERLVDVFGRLAHSVCRG